MGQGYCRHGLGTAEELSCNLQVFAINPLRAWGAVATTVISVALSIYLISISPPYLLPLAWAFAGTAWTGVSPQLCQCICIFTKWSSIALPSRGPYCSPIFLLKGWMQALLPVHW